jgi:hypothetical protein
VEAAPSRPFADGGRLPPPQVVIKGLPSHDELTDLARQQRTSVEGYCRKQADRERKRAGEVEAQIASTEACSADLLNAQREAEAVGNYGQIAKLQDELDTIERELEQAFDELHEIEERAELWERMIDNLAL